MKKTADAFVLTGSKNQLKILLIKRKNDPYKGSWAFPGGFIEKDERPIDACYRELFEETGLDLTKLQPNPNFAYPLLIRKKKGRDPRGPVITYPYLFWIPKPLEVAGADDAEQASWVAIDQVDELAFDHGAILCEALGLLFPGMHSYQEHFKDVKLPQLMLKNFQAETSAPIIFFGGSFNPWHEGHEKCVELCTKQFPNSSIIIIPDTNPWKEINGTLHRHRCFWSGFHSICKKMKLPNVSIYPGLWGMEEAVHVIDWIDKTNFLNIRLLIGDDVLFDILKWKDSTRLLTILKGLLVVPRIHEFTDLQDISLDILKVNPQLEIEVLPQHEFQDISSTKLRDS
ncbi:MAG: NUDIX domain-containing protein [Bacteriovoracaceae bacterium]|nr:NUDIX domain-containing protein [Bacteriovoracaceae bacterium]